MSNKVFFFSQTTLDFAYDPSLIMFFFMLIYLQYLPRSLGVQFQNYLQQVLPAILDGRFGNFEGYL